MEEKNRKIKRGYMIKMVWADVFGYAKELGAICMFIILAISEPISVGIITLVVTIMSIYLNNKVLNSAIDELKKERGIEDEEESDEEMDSRGGLLLQDRRVRDTAERNEANEM